MPLVEVDGGVGLFELCYTMDRETLDRLMGVPVRTKLCSSLVDSELPPTRLRGWHHRTMRKGQP